MAGELGTAVSLIGLAIRLVQCVPEPIRRQFSYLCCFDNNVQFLHNEAAKLEAARFGLQLRVDTAQNNAETVGEHVISWLAEVNEIIQTTMPAINVEIDTIRDGGRFGCHYSVSKRVKELAEDMKELRLQSDNFTIIAHPPQN